MPFVWINEPFEVVLTAWILKNSFGLVAPEYVVQVISSIITCLEVIFLTSIMISPTILISLTVNICSLKSSNAVEVP